MPATESPAPRSKSVSVREGTSDTTRVGGVVKSKLRPRRSFICEANYAQTAIRIANSTVILSRRSRVIAQRLHGAGRSKDPQVVSRLGGGMVDSRRPTRLP